MIIADFNIPEYYGSSFSARPNTVMNFANFFDIRQLNDVKNKFNREVVEIIVKEDDYYYPILNLNITEHKKIINITNNTSAVKFNFKKAILKTLYLEF